MAQAAITCELCQDESVLMNCNSCNIKLCSDCVGRHMTSELSKQHDVVGFRYRKTDVKLPECASHLHQKCEIYCRNCSFPICSQCVVSPIHKHHEMANIMDEYTAKREALLHEESILENYIIPELDKVESTCTLRIAKLSNDYDTVLDALRIELEKKISALKVSLDKKVAVLQQSRDDDVIELKSQIVRISEENNDAKEMLSKYRAALTGINVHAVLSCPLKENQFREISDMVEICAPKYSPSPDSDGKLVDALLGDLYFSERSFSIKGYKVPLKQNSENSIKTVMEKPVLINSFPTGYERLISIFCVGNNEIWVVGSVHGSVTKFNIQGEKLETVQIIQGYSPNDIHIDTHGNILFCDMGGRSVSIWSNGKRETICAWKKWKPTALYLNKMSHILVCMITEDKSNARVVRLVKSKQKQKIQFDDKGAKLFYRPTAVVENINDDICVINMGSKGLVVVDKAGRLRFTYDGTQASFPFFFSPTSLVTDSLGQILIADAMNSCLHILDENGILIRCIGRSILNIVSDLSIDENENLWVGELHSGKIKVLKYLTTQQEVQSIASK